MPNGDVARLCLLFQYKCAVIGGEGGIRTRVGVFSPQTAFEAAPLRPLRYLSGVVSVKLQTVKQLKLGADGPEKTVAAGPLLPLP